MSRATRARTSPSSAYGEEKIHQLARLKSRYDPHNLFRLNQNIEPRPWSAPK